MQRMETPANEKYIAQLYADIRATSLKMLDRLDYERNLNTTIILGVLIGISTNAVVLATFELIEVHPLIKLIPSATILAILVVWLAHSNGIMKEQKRDFLNIARPDVARKMAEDIAKRPAPDWGPPKRDDKQSDAST